MRPFAILRAGVDGPKRRRLAVSGARFPNLLSYCLADLSLCLEEEAEHNNAPEDGPWQMIPTRLRHDDRRAPLPPSARKKW